MNQKLTQGLQKLNIELSPSQISQLETYMQEVMEFNKTYNLMKADTLDDLAINHVLDSLSPYQHIQNLALELTQKQGSITIADIGSGGGCPGIPLATAFPQYKFILVERMEKRCAFLETAIAKMNLQNVTVNCTQADKVPLQSFDLEVFRAFHPFDKKITKLLMGMLKSGGYLAAYKARSEKIQAEMQEIQPMVQQYKIIPLSVPFLEDHERNLVVIQKQ